MILIPYICVALQKMDLNRKINIRSFTLKQLHDEFATLAEPPYRARQVYEWLWAKACTGFDEMSNLPKALRNKLNDVYSIPAAQLSKSQFSADRTIKNTFRLHDDNLVEGVLIPSTNRITACVSSQVGCSLTCKFCATGYLERKRNLYADEIFDQVVLIGRQAMQQYGQPLTNIVYMGMGEPLLNYASVLRSIEHITSEDGLNMAAKRITVSTAGIAKMIKKLGDDEVKFNLALSLHAANDAKRNEIMPINEQNSLQSLAVALKYYYAKTKNPVTYEYIIFNNVNDELHDAAELAKFCRHLPCKVNIIEYNPISFADFANAGADKTEAFAGYLRNQGIITNIRRSRGKDIDAACGQLAGKETMQA